MRAKDRGSFNIFTPPSATAGGMFEAASAGNADFDADEPVGARPSQKGFVASPSRLGAGRSEIVRLVPAHTSLAKARAHAERFKRFRQSRVPHCPALPCTALRHGLDCFGGWSLIPRMPTAAPVCMCARARLRIGERRPIGSY
jgi:hypothetical protein